MFNIGDCVRYTLDGSKGKVLGIDNRLCQVVWEDEYISWEKYYLLELDEEGLISNF